MAKRVITYPDNTPPVVFTTSHVGWIPWLEPLAEGELTDRHHNGLVEASRAKSPYFMLLAHDPDVLGARTRTDKDIFYNTDGGLPRAERELAAAAVSRLNGCILCASVHARFAVQYSKRVAEVDALLEAGPSALEGRWGAIADASAALTQTPSAFGPDHIEALARVGLSEEEIVGLIQSAAFFNWANRLMLSLGDRPGAHSGSSDINRSM